MILKINKSNQAFSKKISRIFWIINYKWKVKTLGILIRNRRAKGLIILRGIIRIIWKTIIAWLRRNKLTILCKIRRTLLIIIIQSRIWKREWVLLLKHNYLKIYSLMWKLKEMMIKKYLRNLFIITRIDTTYKWFSNNLFFIYFNWVLLFFCNEKIKYSAG